LPSDHPHLDYVLPGVGEPVAEALVVHELATLRPALDPLFPDAEIDSAKAART